MRVSNGSEISVLNGWGFLSIEPVSTSSSTASRIPVIESPFAMMPGRASAMDGDATKSARKKSPAAREQKRANVSKSAARERTLQDHGRWVTPWGNAIF